jgi:hypothetical protein
MITPTEFYKRQKLLQKQSAQLLEKELDFEGNAARFIEELSRSLERGVLSSTLQVGGLRETKQHLFFINNFPKFLDEKLAEFGWQVNLAHSVSACGRNGNRDIQILIEEAVPF